MRHRCALLRGPARDHRRRAAGSRARERVSGQPGPHLGLTEMQKGAQVPSPLKNLDVYICTERLAGSCLQCPPVKGWAGPSALPPAAWGGACSCRPTCVPFHTRPPPPPALPSVLSSSRGPPIFNLKVQRRTLAPMGPGAQKHRRGGAGRRRQGRSWAPRRCCGDSTNRCVCSFLPCLSFSNTSRAFPHKHIRYSFCSSHRVSSISNRCVKL